MAIRIVPRSFETLAVTNRSARMLTCALLLLLARGGPLVAQDFWTGEGPDNLWSNPDNWSLGEVPLAGEIRVNGPEAEAANGPLIEDGVDAVAGILIADAGRPTMTMTGGSLELTGWGTWWADAEGTNATFIMSGGDVEFTGNPGIMELGWQDPGAPQGSSFGLWEMTGGEVFAKGIDMPGKNNGGAAVIRLWGGTLNVGTVRGGLIMYDGAQLDITEGELVLEGDQTLQVEDYIEDGWLTAYDGRGDLVFDFDGDFTTVVATNPLLGDYNLNGELDAGDLDLQSQGIKDQDLAFDLNGNGIVEFDDRLAWVHDLKGTWFGDADMDGEFNSGDLVLVFAAGKYESEAMAGWSDGDWDGSMSFDSGDLVAAFTDGGYEIGPRPAAAVPEPSTLAGLLVFVTLALVARRQFRDHTCPLID